MAELSVQEACSTINGRARDLLAVFQDLSAEDQEFVLRIAQRRRHTQQTIVEVDPDSEEGQLINFYRGSIEVLKRLTFETAESSHMVSVGTRKDPERGAKNPKRATDT